MFFAYFTWNPLRELFRIPYLGLPIFWYSLLFAAGFFLGYLVFLRILKKFFLTFPGFSFSEIKDWPRLLRLLQTPASKEQKKYALKKTFCPKQKPDLNDEAAVLEHLNGYLKEQNKERQRLEKAFGGCFYTLSEKASFVADKVAFYMILATIIGARLGHILFYDRALFYFRHPLEIFKIWQGGLASHGAAGAILIALLLLSFKLKNFKPRMGFIQLLDLVAAPTALAAVFIRLGNFFNQEILGTITEKPWGVLFLNPFDGSAPAVRHPVQIYEALFYLLVFLFLIYLALHCSRYVFAKPGRLIGLLLVLVFSFRFWIEFFKVNESVFTNGGGLLMGQYLSLPFILLGLVCFFYPSQEKNFT